ncbi:LAME_0G05666g1_1 [Lachancea meyersii CBS 8951]|uniref:LAME_0G05666g1_1 n=1 Tax=Lachancea meyersii CBS 8951 TaxID=1266667 RepID=A0A1G4K7A6_9SACH|nr:LAME_0G05666g1_1 [Lachancea meyersii CBS 8951]
MAKKSGSRGPIKQVDASLNEPINKDAPPTIYGSHLTPEFASAALNLSVDFLKQQQSMANKYILWHPKTLSVVSFCAIIYLLPNISLPEKTRNASGFVVQFVLMNQAQLLTAGLVLLISTSVVFTLLSKVTENIFKSKVKKVVESEGSSIFGCQLEKLAKGTIKPTDKTKDTQIIVYRDTPIALVSVLENESISKSDSLVMGISSIGSRRVYAKSGIIEDLLDWALIRTKNIQNESDKFNTDKSMKLLVDAYSFDETLKQTLTKKGFSLIKSYKLPESRLLGGLFGVRRELWGVQFHYDTKKQK